MILESHILLIHHTWTFKRVINWIIWHDTNKYNWVVIWGTWHDLLLLPNAVRDLPTVSCGIDWNLSLHHEKTTELLSACHCIFISIQATHMLGYSSARGLPCALQRSASVPALLLLVNLPYWTLPRTRQGQRKETSGKPQCHRVSTTGLPDLDPSASGHLWIRERDTDFVLSRCWMW